MSPRRRTATARVWAAVLFVVLVGAMLWGTTVYVSRGHGKGQLAARAEFSVRTAAIADDVPFLLPDASPARRRDVYIQHVGRSEDEGWLAFSAYAPGQTRRDCHLRWTGARFEDPCTGAHFPPDGTGLTSYPTRVTDGRLYVDLNG
jgi:hypothetical protein